LTLTVVNPHVSESRETEVFVRGGTLNAGSATVLTSSDIHAHNTFDQKNVVVPETRAVQIAGQSLTFTFPPASVTKLALILS
jgi:alpha-N-arabinofuranosidase